MDLRIDNEYVVSLLTKLVNIPSTYPEEEEIMVFLEEELEQLGLTPKRLPVEAGRFNLLASIGEGSPVLCLNAHADTVEPSGDSVAWARVEDDTLYGLGSMDDKASITAILAAAKALLESGVRLKGQLDIMISVDEEGLALGVKTAVKDGYKCDMAITGEGTDLEIVRAHCGLIFLDIITFGKATHGSMPWEGVNAIDRMHELVEGLRAVVTDYAPHPIVGQPSLNLGVMKGGDRPNRVPDRCEASVDIRLVPPMTVGPMLERIADYFAIWSSKAEYKITKQVSPLDTPGDCPLIKSLSDVCRVIAGKSPEAVGWRGWTEAQSFQAGLGIDSVVFGPGSLKQAHSANEFVELEQVRLAAEIYAQMAVSVLS